MKAELKIDRLQAADAVLAIAKIPRLRCCINVGDTYAIEHGSTGPFNSLEIPQYTIIAIEGLQLLSSTAALVAAFFDLRRKSQRRSPPKIVINKEVFSLKPGVEVGDLDRFLRKHITPEGKTRAKRIKSASPPATAKKRKGPRGKGERKSGFNASLRSLEEDKHLPKKGRWSAAGRSSKT